MNIAHLMLFIFVSTNLMCMYGTIESKEQKLEIESPKIEIKPIENDILYAKENLLGGIKSELKLPDIFESRKKEGFIAPVALVQYPPRYPREARYRGIEGFVEVELNIDRRGRIESVRILECSSELFKDPTIDALIRWRFKPARFNGNEIASKAKLRIPFSLIPSSKRTNIGHSLGGY